MNNRKLLNIELGRVSAEEYKMLPESGLVIVLDNIRSAHNVGSAFRTADSFKIDKVWLCGICAVPPSAEIHKSGLGAEDSVEWEHVDDTMDAIRRLKEEGYTIISAEQTVNSVMLDTFVPEKGRRSQQLTARIIRERILNFTGRGLIILSTELLNNSIPISKTTKETARAEMYSTLP